MKMIVTRAMCAFVALLLVALPLQAQSRSALRVGVVAPPVYVSPDSTAHRDRGKHILIGVGVGALAGGTIGGLSARGGQTGTSLDAVATAASVTAGALLGALIGGVIGALWH